MSPKSLPYVQIYSYPITINNQYIKMNICQAELELKKENQINKNANFLDSNINKIQDPKF